MKIDGALTSGMARKCFASRLQNKNVPIATISKDLGYANTKTTDHYLNSLKTSHDDDLDDLLNFRIHKNVIKRAMKINHGSFNYYSKIIESL